MSAADILKMIEEVSPDDTAKLDKIDQEVWFYIEKPKGEKYMRNKIMWSPPPPKYTRSRDSLKAIRPEGWLVKSYQYHTGGFSFELNKYIPTPEGVHRLHHTSKMFVCQTAPTEELAELHAIIQAIEYERNAKKP